MSNTTLRRGATSQSKVMTLSPADEKCDHSSARTPALTVHLFIVQVSCRYNALPLLWTWYGATVDWTIRYALTWPFGLPAVLVNWYALDRKSTRLNSSH